MRWACLLLPHLAMDAVLRAHPEPKRPLVLVAGPAQRRELHAVSPAAAVLGLRRGMLVSALKRRNSMQTQWFMRGRIFFSLPRSGLPNRLTVPEEGSVNPRSIRMVVVFPAPLRPNKP